MKTILEIAQSQVGGREFFSFFIDGEYIQEYPTLQEALESAHENAEAYEKPIFQLDVNGVIYKLSR